MGASYRGLTILVCTLGCAGTIGCAWLDDRPSPPESLPYTANARAASRLFTPAHSTVTAAVKDFFGVRASAVQPFEFSHRTHVEEGLVCTEACHASVTKGPRAGLPSVSDCLSCHATVATDRPLIKQIVTLAERGRDFDWQRVYGFTAQAHVRFNHAPHIRASVACSTCHGDIGQQTFAQRNVDVHMGFCVGCHRQKQASTECSTCHF